VGTCTELGFWACTSWQGTGWDILASVGTVAALAASGFAIWLAVMQGRRASDRLRKERRVDFELDALKELIDLLAPTDGVAPAAWRTQILARLSVLEPATLPSCRREVHANNADNLYTRIIGGQADGPAIQALMLAEVNDRIRALLEERD
jgi:hypothetical protein